MIQRLAALTCVLAGGDGLWGSAAQIGIIREEGFGETGFKSVPILDVKACGEAGDQLLNFENVFHVYKSTSGGRVGRGPYRDHHITLMLLFTVGLDTLATNARYSTTGLLMK